MPLFLKCSAGHRLKVPSKLAGLRIVCPVCNEGLDVPPLPPPPRFKASAPPEKQETQPSPSPSKPLDNKTKAEPTAKPEATPNPTPAPPRPAARPPVPPPAAKEPLAESQPQDFDEANVTTPPLAKPARDIPAPIALPADDPRDHETLSQHLQFEREAFNGEADFDDDLRVIVVQDDATADPNNTDAESGFIRGQRWGVMALGIASILIAIFCAIPAAVDQYNARQIGLNPPDTWTYLVLMGSLIQIAIAIYAIRLPDWATSWTASIVATFFAAVYALGLALTMFASQEHALVKSLGLLDEAFATKAQPWSAMVMCVMLILAYSYGRFSLRWYRLDRQLVATQSRVA